MINERDDLYRLLSDDDFSISEIEDLGFRSILPYILEMGGYEIVLYGASGKGYDVLCWLKSHNIEPLCMIDGDIAKHNTYFFGKKVVHIDSLTAEITNKKIYAIICTSAYDDFEQRHAIYKKLNRAGCEDIFPFEHIATKRRYWTPYLKMNKENLVCLYDELYDAESKNALYEYIRASILDIGYKGFMHRTNEKYFASDIYKSNYNECIIDCGAYNGDTIFNIIRLKKEFEKIYAIEADAIQIKNAKEFIKYLPNETQSKIVFHNVILGKEQYSGETIDQIFEGKKITMIKTDLEGADYDAIVGAEKIIKKHMPVLAIAAYHLDSDLINIPSFIRAISPEYKFFLRKYYHHDRKLPNSELILYAVPKNRIVSHCSC